MQAGVSLKLLHKYSCDKSVSLEGKHRSQHERPLILSICLVVNRLKYCRPRPTPTSATAWTSNRGNLPHRLRGHLLQWRKLDQKPGQQTDAVYLSGQWSQLSGVGWVHRRGGKKRMSLSDTKFSFVINYSTGQNLLKCQFVVYYASNQVSLAWNELKYDQQP